MFSLYLRSIPCMHYFFQDASSRDNLGDVTYYPPNGFHFKYFPDIGQPSWKSPLVFVRFESPTPAVLLRIICKLYASDIIHSRILDTGTVSFELLVDKRLELKSGTKGTAVNPFSTRYLFWGIMQIVQTLFRRRRAQGRQCLLQ